ncbi:hypothetical protein MTR67_003237 [Solanum verrucosum]|uniref:Integrase zinc-binding domain-containing protein n=1 Tax=Solanum verrucosum TaxID=315347 RepID=A0AAF0PS47_SOLVR|nr:hypothetical protein MTR67_003237 [Solanum verrucosum]
MSVQEYNLLFSQLSRYALKMVADMRNKMSLFVSELSRVSIREGKIAMLIGDMSISRLMIHVQQEKKDKLKDIKEFYNKRTKTINHELGQQKTGNGNWSSFQQRSSGALPSSDQKNLVDVVNAEVKEMQDNDPILPELKANVHKQKVMTFEQGGDDALRYYERLCDPKMDELQERIMTEAQSSIYSIHLGSTKMYHDLREVYWWSVMKRCIAEFVAKCLNFMQVKVEHQRPCGVAQKVALLKWK